MNSIHFGGRGLYNVEAMTINAIRQLATLTLCIERHLTWLTFEGPLDDVCVSM